jgi:hypothetical protein
VIRVYDAGNVIATHEHTGDFKETVIDFRFGLALAGDSTLKRRYARAGPCAVLGVDTGAAEIRMIWLVFILFAALVSCEKQARPEPNAPPKLELELSELVKYTTERHSALLAAKYHLPRATVQAITEDFRIHQFMVLGLFTSPKPAADENMEQTIGRLSAAHKIPTDVVASLIIDDLLLDKAPEQ